MRPDNRKLVIALYVLAVCVPVASGRMTGGGPTATLFSAAIAVVAIAVGIRGAQRTIDAGAEEATRRKRRLWRTQLVIGVGALALGGRGFATNDWVAAGTMTCMGVALLAQAERLRRVVG